jgi:hypothetical protein
MPVSPDRIATIAEAARVPIPAGAAERIALAIAPAVTRFAEHPLTMAFETEPATFAVVAGKDRQP